MLVCVGVLAMLMFQIFENVGMTMGIMPVTGIPLPFVSYGGSSTIAEFAAIGLVLNVHMRRFASLLGSERSLARCLRRVRLVAEDRCRTASSSVESAQVVFPRHDLDLAPARGAPAPGGQSRPATSAAKTARRPQSTVPTRCRGC